MIYTRFGTVVTITKAWDSGQVEVKKSDGEEKTTMRYNLKADGGSKEIDKAIAAVGASYTLKHKEVGW